MQVHIDLTINLLFSSAERLYALKMGVLTRFFAWTVPALFEIFTFSWGNLEEIELIYG